MALDPIQIRFLRGLAHDLNPIVMIGQKGMSDGVRVELDDALSRHELVKIRVVAEERVAEGEGDGDQHPQRDHRQQVVQQRQQAPADQGAWRRGQGIGGCGVVHGGTG